MEARDLIGKTVKINVDCPLGSQSEKGFYYPVNYGFIPGAGLDEHELDAYIIGIYRPVPVYEGRCIAVIHRLDNQQDKLVVAPPGKQYTDDQIRALVEFQEQYFTSVILRKE
jgi:inorganic pyrophosphatase